MKLRHIISEGSIMPRSMRDLRKKLDNMTPDEIRAFFKNREDFAKQHAGGVIRPGYSAKELAQGQELRFGRDLAKRKPYSRHFESTQKPYVSQAADGQWNVLDKNGKTVFSSSNYNVVQDYFKKNYDNLKETEVDEDFKSYMKGLAAAGMIAGSVAGAGAINKSMNDSVPVIQAMNKALDVAQQKGDTQLIQNIKQDIEVARLSLDSGRDLNTVKNMQDRYAKFMPADYKPSTPAPKFKEAEEVAKTDTLTIDIPMFIRLMEYAREDAKTDMDLHNVTTNLLKIKDKIISMADYDQVVQSTDVDTADESFKKKIVQPVKDNKKEKIQTWWDKYSKYKGGNGNTMSVGYLEYALDSGIGTDAYNADEYMKVSKKMGMDDPETEMDQDKLMSMMPITKAMFDEIAAITGTNNLEKNGKMINNIVNYFENQNNSDPMAGFKEENLSFKDKIAKKIVQPIKDYNKKKEQEPKKS